VLFAKAVVPPKTAVIFFVPFFENDVEKFACPDPFTAALPSVLLPSLNVTVPVGIAPVNELTTAMNVTVWLTVDGFGVEVSVVVVVIGFIVCFTWPELLPV
jgi:hypothetical protein